MATFRPTSPERLDRFLASAIPQVSRSKVAKMIEEGKILVDGKREKPSFKVMSGMSVFVDEIEETQPHDLAPAHIDLNVVYEDDDLLVVDKPRGLATHPAPSLREPSLVNALLGRGSDLSTGSASYRPGIVHRLDKETTGLLVVAKTDRAHANLAKQIASKTAERTYLAIVGGDETANREFTISAPLARDPQNRKKMAVHPDGKPAVTHVKVLRRVNAGTLVECKLETGRTHQIRVHLRSIGLPVIGDKMYAPKEFQTAPLQLHAWKLAFQHPETGVDMQFEVEPPQDFLAKSTPLRLAPTHNRVEL